MAAEIGPLQSVLMELIFIHLIWCTDRSRTNIPKSIPSFCLLDQYLRNPLQLCRGHLPLHTTRVGVNLPNPRESLKTVTPLRPMGKVSFSPLNPVSVFRLSPAFASPPLSNRSFASSVPRRSVLSHLFFTSFCTSSIIQPKNIELPISVFYSAVPVILFARVSSRGSPFLGSHPSL